MVCGDGCRRGMLMERVDKDSKRGERGLPYSKKENIFIVSFVP